MADTATRFIEFVDKCPFPFQFCAHASELLKSSGFTELDEKKEWGDIPKKGFFLRDGRALVAFNKGGLASGIIVGTHNDSPCLKIKPNHQVPGGSQYSQIAVAQYGGGIWKTWFDRNLRLAGRFYETTEEGFKVHNVDSKEGIGFIPCSNVVKNELQLQPILGGDPKFNLIAYLSKLSGVPEEKIGNFELGFVDSQKPAVVGTKGDFIASQRIDNLGSTFCALEAFLKTEPKGTLNVLVVFDHEEIGSNTLAGAKSDLLASFFTRIIPKEEYAAFIARSLAVSSDNAHAWHPNYVDVHEVNHRPLLGGGPILKRSPGSSYASDITSSYPIKKAAEMAGLNIGVLLNRNDIIGGSTIGPHVSSGLGIPTVDIGQPQLAMHSIRELMAVSDIDDLTKLLEVLYEKYEEIRLKY